MSTSRRGHGGLPGTRARSALCGALALGGARAPRARTPPATLVVLALLSGLAWGGEGTRAGEFLRIGIGARPAGMGEAFTAVADDVNALYWNPAGLGYLNTAEILAMHAKWLGDLNYDTLGAVVPLPRGAVAGGLQYLWHQDAIPYIRNGTSLGAFRSATYAGAAGYGLRLSTPFAAGLTAKYYTTSVSGVDQRAGALAGDVGILLRSPKGMWSWGFVAQNFGTKPKFDTGEDSPPMTFRSGVAWMLKLPNQAADFNVALDAEKPAGTIDDVFQADNWVWTAGIEHLGAGILALRAGYRYPRRPDGQGQSARWRFGGGLRTKHILLDYAFMPFDSLGEVHRFSLGYRFGAPARPILKPPSEVILLPEWSAFSPNGDGVRDTVKYGILLGNFGGIKVWSFEVKAADSRKIVRRMAGQLMLPATLVWDGKDDAGQVVPDGRYAYSFLAEDTAGGQALSKEDVVLVDATPPTVTLSASTTIFMPGPTPPVAGLASAATGLAQGTTTPPAAGLPTQVTFYMSAQDASGVERWRLSIQNSQQKTVKTFEGRGAVGAGAGLTWDGRDDYYERTVERDTYTIRLVAYDLYGSRGVSPDVQVAVGALPSAPPPKKPEEPKFMTINLSSKLLFAAKRWTLKPQAYDEIDQKVVKVLKQYPETRVSIEGHTDDREGGGRLNNRELSSKRAWSIYGYLARRGIARARMSVKGWGPDRPLDSNRSVVGRERNRRVEVIIFGRKQVK